MARSRHRASRPGHMTRPSRRPPAAITRNRMRGGASWRFLLRKDAAERTARRAFEIGAGGPVLARRVEMVEVSSDVRAGGRTVHGVDDDARAVFKIGVVVGRTR